MLFDTIFRSFSQPLPTEPENVAKPVRRTYGNDAVILALRRANKSLSVSALAAAMGCSVGESSKRVKAASRFLKVKKVGRCKMVCLKELSRKDLLKMMATMENPGDYWGHPA